MFGLDPTLTTLLILCLLAACVFEFINGFHDTANAVATVIYTNALKPKVAVVWSGIMNATGVFMGGVAVAMGISNLLPIEVLTDTNIYHNIALILSLLLTAILWNFGTWYLGIPCSSSHTLIGAMLGVGLAYSIGKGSSASFVNWGKAQEIGMSLLLSPLFGFSLAIMLMYILRVFFRKKRTLFKEPSTNQPPPFWIRLILLTTCSVVSFSHGSNDGQKGVGLIMLILIAIVPFQFTLDHTKSLEPIASSTKVLSFLISKVDASGFSKEDSFEYVKTSQVLTALNTDLSGKTTLQNLPVNQQYQIRKDIILLGKSGKKLLSSDGLSLSNNDKDRFEKELGTVKSLTDYAPGWVIIMIAISLGLGTMVGWKRIVETIGEKIGKEHLSYAQGASSELVAAVTISFSTQLGLPVSTTQVLSSGIAGSMVASKGVKNLQKKTIRNIFIAWILTLPVCILVSGLLFLLFRSIL